MSLLKNIRRKWAIKSMPRVASLATMPSRIKTLKKVTERILPQVDLMYVFLDGFETVPAYLNNNRIVVHRSQDHGDWHCAGRYIALEMLHRPSIITFVDDDISYPRNYVSRLAHSVAAYQGQAIVGVHGRQFLPPYESYVTDAKFLHFEWALKGDTRVDELGGGTCAFLSTLMTLNFRNWPETDANDLHLALEAKRRSIPLISIKRRARWLYAYAQEQADSLWLRTKMDPSRKIALMRELMDQNISTHPDQATDHQQ